MPFGLPNVSYVGYPPMLSAGHAGLGFRQATAHDTPAIRDHLLRLSPEDRRARFCAGLSDAAVEAHAASLWTWAGLVITAHDGPLWPGLLHAAGPVRALAEVAIDGREAEIGLSVDGNQRRRGVGGYLVQTAARLLAPRGVERLLAYTVPGNTPMLRLARSSGARIVFGGADVEIVFRVDALRQAYLRRRITEQVFRAA